MSYRSLFSDTSDDPLPTPETQRYRLLLVDDEPLVLSSLKRVFRHKHYTVLTAETPAQALEIVIDQAPHLVISDFKMPGMHGGDLLRRIKDHAPGSVRILLTGHADTEAVLSAIKEGVIYRFILKPWNDDDLLVTVALALEQYELFQRNRQMRETNNRQSRELALLSKLSITSRSQLGILLHKKGHLTTTQLQRMYRAMQQNKMTAVRYVVAEGWLSEQVIFTLLKRESFFESIDLDEMQLDSDVMALVPRDICQHHAIIPLRVQRKRLLLAMADPLDQAVLESLGFASGFTIEPLVATASAIDSKLAAFHGDQDSLQDIATLVATMDPQETIQIVIEDDQQLSVEELLTGSEEPPAVLLVNAIISEALRLRASDIHIQPCAKYIVVRYRIDGILQEKIQIPSHLLMPLISRIKVMADLDIAERRRPQDGRITVKTSMRVVDLRISSLPTINGEKIVMRVLDRQASVKRIEKLGLSAGNRELLLDVVTRPQGIILATGPTGSGKTTTLYAMLQHNATPEKNYVTIEDPVEFYVDMAGQVPVRDRIGLGFSSILRAILRQDPDVILLGEIRDRETAEVAFNAALTGHVVYSTLHTNSAVATIARLLDLGLAPYIIASALEAIISQRLLRSICQHCRIERQPPPALAAKLGPLFKADMPCLVGVGCEHCNGSGYSGRVPVHEVMIINTTLREAIVNGISGESLAAMARQLGMKSLLEDALDKVAGGMTTVDEVLRIFGNQRGTAATSG